MALVALPVALPAQSLDYSSLLDSLNDGSSEGSDSSSSLNVGSLLNQLLLKQALTASATPSRSSGAATPAPAPTPVYHNVCPICGTSFPGTAPYKGVAWGMRLDLRMYGQIQDPAPAPLCPKCRFVIYKTTYEETELSRLRPYVNSAEYRGIDQRNVSYYYLARLREKSMVKMQNGDYDIAHAFLQAAWQAEDLGDSGLTRQYLEKALYYTERYAKTAAKTDAYYTTVKILAAELLRRLGRFPEAEAAIERVEGGAEFQAAYLQRIIAAEKALIAVEDPRPADSP
jgi:hypothetical protein